MPSPVSGGSGGGGGGTGCNPTSVAGQILIGDGLGGCVAGLPTISGTTITASITGHASLDLPLTGGTISGTLTVSGHTTFEGITSTGATGTGKLVYDGSPTLVTPNLGTPSAAVLTNATGLPEGGLTLSDVTTLNASTSKHGFLLKLDNNSAHFMDGTGAWSTPAGAGTPISGATATALVTAASATTLQTPSATSTLDSSGNLVAAGTVTATAGLKTGATPPTLTSGTGGAIGLAEGTAPAACPASGVDCLYASSASHAILGNFNNDGYLPLARVGGAQGTPASITLTNGTGLPEAGLTLADNTTNNASTSNHGFLLKLDNNSAHFMNGQGAWATPAGGGSGCVPSGSATQIITDNGSGGCTSNAAAIFSSGTLSLGTAGSVVGGLKLFNATSGSITLQPVTGALGSITISVPANAQTLVVAPTSTTTTQALFATSTAGAPAFRAFASGDLPTGTKKIDIMFGSTFTVDSTGNAIPTPLTQVASITGPPFFAHNVIAFANPNSGGTNSCVFGAFTTPWDYVSTPAFVFSFMSTATSGNAAFTIDYTDLTSTTAMNATTSGSGALSGTATAVSGTANREATVSISGTSGDFHAGDLVQWKGCRIQTSDTVAATVYVPRILWSYAGTL